MQIEQKSENFISSEGKFFKAVEEDSNGVKTYRQLELYLPGDVGTYREPLEVTRTRWLEELERGERVPRFGTGTTGKPLTARYRIRAMDGQLVSVLALSGGLKKAAQEAA